MDPLSFAAGTALGAGSAIAVRRYLTARRPQEEGLADRLLWAVLFAPGVILLKDGTFLAGFTVRGRDLETAPAGAVNAAARAVHAVLKLLGEGYALEVNMHRIPIKEYPAPELAHFPTPLLHQVDAERRVQFTRDGTYFQTENVMLVSYTPPPDAMQRMESLFVEGRPLSQDYGHLLQSFRRTLSDVTTCLGGEYVMASLDSTALVTECHRCLTGLHHIVQPDGGFLSHQLASRDLTTGFTPRLGREHIVVISLTSLGAFVRVAGGDFFNGLREDARWHFRWVGLSRHAAEKRIKSAQNRWFHQRKGLRAFMPGSEDSVIEDQDAVEMQQETGSALADVTSGRMRLGYFSSTLILRDTQERRGHARAAALLQRLRDAGLTGTRESTNATAAFFGSLPGHGVQNLRRHLVTSTNFAHLFPSTTPWAGDAHCPSPLLPDGSSPLMYASAYGATPFRLNLHHEDVGHTLVIGATGAGKSVLAGALMMSWLRYPSSRVFCFDVGGSHTVLTALAGGEHLRLGEGAGPTVQPLRHIDAEVDQLWAQHWVESICTIAGCPPTPKQRTQIAHAIRLVGARRHERRDLSNLYVNLPAALQVAVEPYTRRGTFGYLFDGRCADAVGHHRVRTVELRDVLGLGDTVVAPLLMALFRQVERALDGSPTLIVIEEAWAALLRSDFAARMQQWLLTLRKQNAAVMIIAHSPAQIQSLANAAIITESCPTRILLPNPEARIPAQADVYRSLGLGEREIGLIADARQRRDYYYKSPRGSRLFDMQLGPRARTVLTPLPGRSIEDSRKELLGLHSLHGDRLFDHIDHS